MQQSMSFAELVAGLGATLLGGDNRFDSLSTDTRTLQPGDAYLALRGAHFDGHDFAAAAVEQGASGLIVERAVAAQLPQLVVPDSQLALGKIAALNRQRSRARVIALTGSQGKTTVKEMIRCILAECGTTLATRANLNNTIGVPSTLLRLDGSHRFAVIEIGANKAGEIAFSASLTRPDIALITGASPAHLEGFGSLQGIVEAKGEILDSLSDTGVAVLNADDRFVQRWLERSQPRPTVLFSGQGNPRADYIASRVQTGKDRGVVFQLLTPQGEIDISLPLLGAHNATNATAAAAAAMVAGASLRPIQRGLAAVQPTPGRLMQRAGQAGALLIDDTYNASPASFQAAIDVLAQFDGRKVVIAGDMKELGTGSGTAHTRLGRHARQCGIDALWTTGDYAPLAAQSFGNGGRVFASQQELIAYCRQQLGAGDVCLVKGSRGAQMENVISSLVAGGG